MVLLLITLATLAAILVAVVRTVASDGYGVRPPPRSHRAEEELDAAQNRGSLPLRPSGSGR